MESHLQQARRLREEAAEAEKLNEELRTLKVQIDQLTKEEADLLLDLDNRRFENEALMKNIDELQQAIIENERKNKEICDTMVMKPSDNARMIKAKEMLDLGKALTGIRWNYSTSDNITAGYVANKENGILKAFEYETNKENLQNELWNKIEAATSANWSDLVKSYIDSNAKCDKENIPTNI